MGEAKRIRDAIHQVDAETAIDQVKTLQQVVDDSVASPRLTTGLLGVFALLALVITAAGITGVMALAVTHSLPLFALIAFAPVLARTFWSLLKPARPLNLKRIGITEIIYSLIFLIFTTLSFRLAM